MVVSVLGLMFASTGTLRRFVLKDMGEFDRQTVVQTQVLHEKFAGWMKDSGGSVELQKQYAEMLSSPELNSAETRAGGSLVAFAVEGAFLVLLMTASGSVAGFLQRRRVAITQQI